MDESLPHELPTAGLCACALAELIYGFSQATWRPSERIGWATKPQMAAAGKMLKIYGKFHAQLTIKNYLPNAFSHQQAFVF